MLPLSKRKTSLLSERKPSLRPKHALVLVAVLTLVCSSVLVRTAYPLETEHELSAELWAGGFISAGEFISGRARFDSVLHSRMDPIPPELESFRHIKDEARPFRTLDTPSLLKLEARDAGFEFDCGVGYNWFSGRGSLEDFATLEVPIEELIAGDDGTGRHFDFYREEEARFEPNARIGVVGRVGSFFWAATETKLSLVESLGSDEHEVLSAGIKSWRGGTFTFEKALASVEHGPLAVWFGRDRLAWRLWPGRGLLFSGFALPSDGFGLDIRAGSFGFSCANIDLTAYGVSKKASAHQLRFAPMDWLLISTAEAVVYHGDFLLSYVNPFTVYYAVQHNEQESDNILWHSEIVARVMPGAVIATEILVDDYQYDKTGPNKVAFSPEIWLQKGRLEFSGRYVHAAPEVYMHTCPELSFSRGDEPLGFPMSPDSDFLSAKMTFHVQSWLYTWAEMIYLRRSADDETPRLEGGGVEIGTRMFRAGIFDFQLSGIVMKLGQHDYSAVYGELAVEFPGAF